MDEAGIPAFCFQKIAVGVGLPREYRYLGTIRPAERTGGRSLIEPVDPPRVMRPRSAKPVAPFWIADVGVGSRIDQNLVITRADHDAQGIGMAMASTPRPEWTGVDDRLIRARHHHRNTCVGEEQRCPLPFPRVLLDH